MPSLRCSAAASPTTPTLMHVSPSARRPRSLLSFSQTRSSSLSEKAFVAMFSRNSDAESELAPQPLELAAEARRVQFVCLSESRCGVGRCDLANLVGLDAAGDEPIEVS